MRFDQYPYGPVAFFYDELAAAYSLGRIGESKRACLEAIEPGDRVLFAGAGRGAEAILAAHRGASVTAVDLSRAMLDRLDRRFSEDGFEVDCLLEDVARHESERGYDVVVANYFLNLFDLDRTESMLGHLAGLVRPGGLLVLADFARPTGGAWGRLISEAYYRPVNWLAWALGFCALHPIADYPPMLERVGFRVRSIRRFPLWRGRSNPAYVSLIAERDPEIDPSIRASRALV